MTVVRHPGFDITSYAWSNIMRGVLLWLVGIPIPIIILLYLFNVL